MTPRTGVAKLIQSVTWYTTLDITMVYHNGTYQKVHQQTDKDLHMQAWYKLCNTGFSSGQMSPE